MSDYKLTPKEKKLGFDDVEKTIKSAIAGLIDYKNYHFVLSEDGDLYFIKKDAINRPTDYEPQDLKNWPCSYYDGIELWSTSTGEDRGTVIVAIFLKAIKAKHI